MSIVPFRCLGGFARLVALACCWIGAAHAAEPSETAVLESNAVGLVQSVFKPVARQPKPARFGSFAERLDYVHHNLYNDYNTRVARTDQFIGQGLADEAEPAASRFRLGLFSQISQGESTEFAFKPDFSVDIDLPNLEKRWKVIVNSTRPSELPGRDPTEKSDAVQVGVSTAIKVLRTSLSAGVRVKWLPEGYVQSKWGPCWSWGAFQIRPGQKLFFETDDLFGEQTSLKFYRWLGEQHRFKAEYWTAGTFSQSTDGLEWEHTFRGMFVRELLEESSRGEDTDDSDMARGIGARYSMFGSDKSITEHRVALVYRRPFYKQWIYLEVDPGLKWRLDSAWDVEPYVLLGLDFYFWGTDCR